MKKWLFTLLLILSIEMPALADPISVTVNHAPVLFDVNPVIENGRTLVPMRPIFEALGAIVQWENETRTAVGTRDGITVRVPVDSKEASVNTEKILLDVPAKIIDGRTFVPVRFVSESLQCDVKWQINSQTVIITDGAEKASRPLSVHFIDVGQGDCILICLPNNEEILIDAGNNGDGNMICDYLAARGIYDIEYAIGTHPHADHIGGMDDVLKKIPVKALYMPEKSADTKTYRDVLTAAENSNTPIKTGEAGVVLLDRNGLSVALLSPKDTTCNNLNDVSIVLSLTYVNRTFLFMGDAEVSVEESLTSVPPTDVLKVGHHGSFTSSSPLFLSRIMPKFAVISCGAGNRYGHPHTETLLHFSAIGTKVLRTDISKTIVFSSDGDSLTYQTAA